MQLIPNPTHCKELPDTLCLSGEIFCTAEDDRLRCAAQRLSDKLPPQAGAPVTVTLQAKEPAEGYALSLTAQGVSVCGNSAAGAFWGLQTLEQMIRTYGADALPCCDITDAPAFPERGFYHDITRGKVATLDTLKQLVDQLALCKINSLQLYVEHAFTFKEYEGIVSAENQMTAAEMRELDDYCYERFIELVPSLSTFGHLYHLLQSDRYRHLCELENYQPSQIWLIERMAHHTIDAYQEESIALIESLIDQFVPCFRSGRFNICCDETFDLCNGRNKGQDKAETYINFVKKIIACVQKHGKQVMMWGDILLEHPELLSQLPPDILVLNWDYAAKPNEERVAAIARLGQPQVLCPGTTTWNYAAPYLPEAIPNITAMARLARTYGAKGILNTNWGDYGNIGSLSPALYPMAVGAACSWNPDTVIDEAFERAAAAILYGDPTGKSIALLHQMAACEAGSPWAVLCRSYQEADKITYTAEELQNRIQECARIAADWKQLAASGNITEKLAAEMQSTCRTAAMFCGILWALIAPDTAVLPEEPAVWMAYFTKEWLLYNKESELPEITALLKDMLATAGKEMV